MALSRSKIYALGTAAVIIAALCITIPLVLNQKSHSSNPNNATRALATTVAEALATATSPTTAQVAVTEATNDSPKMNPADELADPDKEDSAGDQADTATREGLPMNAEDPKKPEQPTRVMPEATQPTHMTHEDPEPANPSPTQDLPGTTHEEPQRASSALNLPSPSQPEYPHSGQPDQPGSSQLDQVHETQPTAMETHHPDVRQPEQDNMNGAVSPQVSSVTESSAPVSQGFLNTQHIPMTTALV